MLELRPNCEHCDVDLPPDSTAARICTFECTFCSTCVDSLLGGVCPNCTGELVPRPTRPRSLGDAAASTSGRVHSPVDLPAHRTMLAGRATGPDHAGVALRRYATAWRAGDIDTVIDCYHPEFTLHYSGRSRFAGTHSGREAALAVMVEVSVLAPRELVAVDQLLVGEDAGALVVTERLTRGDDTVDVRRTLEYRVEGGHLVECWLLEHDQATVDHMWR